MGKDSSIEWTNHTWNPWRGCQRVSPGCEHCYAEAGAKRNPATFGRWGPNGTRVVAAESMWRQPLKWDREAREAGERHRVFTASVADVFEDWDGPMVGSNGHPIYVLEDGRWWRSLNGGVPASGVPLSMEDCRARLLGLIAATQHLDWLILTKRPERMLAYFNSRARMWEAAAAYRDLIYGDGSEVGLGDGLKHWPPSNVWLGTTVEDQKRADERIPHLLATPASVRFLSVEPMLGPIDLRNIGDRYDALMGEKWGGGSQHHDQPQIDWVIVGGESGSQARPFDLTWARSIRDQCQAAGVPFFMKQVGANPIIAGREPSLTSWKPIDSHGGDWDEWPEDLRVREFPTARLQVPAR